MPIIVTRTVQAYPGHVIRYTVLSEGVTVIVTVQEYGCNQREHPIGDLHVTDARLSPATDKNYPADLAASAIQAATEAVERQLAEDARPGATRRGAMALTPAGVGVFKTEEHA